MGRIKEGIEKQIDKARKFANSITTEKNHLICVRFSGLCEDYYDIDMIADISRFAKLSEFDLFLETAKAKGFNIIEPNDIVEGNISGKDLLIVFEGGYFNNYLAVDVLKKHEGRAVFFPNPYYIEANKSFWQDIIYRNETKRMEPSRIRERINTLSTRPLDDIFSFINDNYGSKAAKAINDRERPMSIDELATFAEFDEVVIGNAMIDGGHNLKVEDIRGKISKANDFIGAVCGKYPTAILLPFGINDCSAISSFKEIRVAISKQDGVNKFENSDEEPDIRVLKSRVFPGFGPEDRDSKIDQLLEIGFFD